MTKAYCGVMLLSASMAQAGMLISDVEEAIELASAKYDVPTVVLKAVCRVESNHNPKAVNKYDGGSASHGLCQLKTKTAKHMGYSGPVRGLYDPYVNADLAGKYLSYQFKRYNRNWIKAISAYNRGHALESNINIEYLNKVFIRVINEN